eukprot:GDKH01017253.1.p1 GENE.GDKH01017253.1~~GDKH01017253.1.p1  ORF type:complete len:272 (-),score=97.05 GDKH01017253.1:110-925(-)
MGSFIIAYITMARGPKKHLKRVAAPSHWMLGKLTGLYAPRPSQGPHKLRECVPLALLLRNRLKYALTYNETKYILMQRTVKVDAKVRTDHCFPAGFQDVITIDKTGEHFRILFETKGRFVPHKISATEAAYKLCRVKRVSLGAKGIPQAVTHDGRTIRYIHPEVKDNDTIRIDLATGKVLDFVKFEVGNLVMLTGGNNVGRVGTITHREPHPGSVEIVHIQDARGHKFATRLSNIFVIGEGNKAWISLPKGGGIKLNEVEDRNQRLAKQAQ